MPGNNITGLDGTFMFQQPNGQQRNPTKLGCYLPLLGGTRPPSVGAFNYAVAAASTVKLIDKPGFLSGVSQLIETGSNALIVDLFDGDPGGSDYERLFRFSVASGGIATFPLGGGVLVWKRKLFITATGTTPAATLILHLNY